MGNQKYWLNGDLKPAFDYSKLIIDHHAKSFSFASRFLPEDRKWGTYAVYNFCRFADNIIDNPRHRTRKELIDELDSLRIELSLAYKYGESEHPALKAFIQAANIFSIPKIYAEELLTGVEIDLTIKRYESFDKLYLFCYRVASTVGLMMTYVLGFEGGKNTLEYAEKLGIAMQLTNILRDVAEDVQLGRVYLPQEDIEKWGVRVDDILEKKFSVELKNFLEFEVNRALQYYNDSQPGIDYLDKNSRFAIRTASKIYGEILQKIVQNNYNPFLGRVYVPKSHKIKILISELFNKYISIS